MDDESGATAIEYGLIAALIAVGIIAAATTLGNSLSNLFNTIESTITRKLICKPNSEGGRKAPFLCLRFVNHTCRQSRSAGPSGVGQAQ